MFQDVLRIFPGQLNHVLYVFQDFHMGLLYIIQVPRMFLGCWSDTSSVTCPMARVTQLECDMRRDRDTSRSTFQEWYTKIGTYTLACTIYTSRLTFP